MATPTFTPVIYRFNCACTIQHQMLPAPGQRALDFPRINQLKIRLKMDIGYRDFHQPIFVVLDQYVMYIVDGQHRYGAHKELCNEGIHRYFDILYIKGDKKTAEEAYENQLLQAPQPLNHGLSVEEKDIFTSCSMYLKSKPGNLGNGGNRPNYYSDKLIQSYKEVYPENKKIEEFKDTIDGLNLYLKNEFDEGKKFGITGQSNIDKITGLNLYYGLMKNDDYVKWLTKYKAQSRMNA